MAKAYTTKENIEIYLNETITDNLDLYIKASKEYIDNFTGQIFEADEEETTRLYDGTGRREMIVDSLIELIGVKADDLDIEVITYPYNKTPIYKLIAKNGFFPKGVANVAVEAKFGWSEIVPAEIAMCATILASGLYMANRSGGEIASEKVGEYSVSYKTDSQKNDFANIGKILQKYRDLC